MPNFENNEAEPSRETGPLGAVTLKKVEDSFEGVQFLDKQRTDELLSNIEQRAGDDKLSEAEAGLLLDKLVTNKYILEERILKSIKSDKARGQIRVRINSLAKALEKKSGLLTIEHIEEVNGINTQISLLEFGTYPYGETEDGAERMTRTLGGMWKDVQTI